jgi:pyruvate ferredoxin oxidoreductase alpha subunit
VRLPALVNLDGFTLSFTREPVEIPDADAASRFVGPFEPGSIRFRASRPISQAVAVLGGSPYSYFRYEMHLAALNALAAYDEVAAGFARELGRERPAVDAYRTDDADVVFFMIGAFATGAREAVDRLRQAGQRVGLVRPLLVRPYPAARIRALLDGVRGVAVVDQNLSIGQGGVLHAELAAALAPLGTRAPLLASFIGGLGGRDLAAEEFYEMAAVTRAAAERGEPPEPRLLYTETELREQRKLQGIAVAERHEPETSR